jgi:hypothetical protein
MKNTDILNRITALLNIKVKLEQQTLENGTVVESDSFSVGDPIFAINGDVKQPLEIGEYVMADGSKLSVTEIGIIGEIASASTETVEEEMSSEIVEELSTETVEETVEEKVEELAEVPPTIEEVIAKVMEAVQPKIDELQAKIDALTGTQTEMKATLSSATVTKPTIHKPSEKVTLGKQNTKANLSATEARIMAMLS